MANISVYTVENGSGDSSVYEPNLAVFGSNAEALRHYAETLRDTMEEDLDGFPEDLLTNDEVLEAHEGQLTDIGSSLEVETQDSAYHMSLDTYRINIDLAGTLVYVLTPGADGNLFVTVEEIRALREVVTRLEADGFDFDEVSFAPGMGDDELLEQSAAVIAAGVESEYFVLTNQELR